jgi:Uma2 family endonuclease
MTTKARATVDDLYRIPENTKAEIVDGEIILMSPTGDMPVRAGFKIAMSLSHLEGKIPGRAFPDNVGYKVNLPDRDSFSPDASFYVGQPGGMRFLEGAPVFAVEVRSENDYGA